MGFFSYPINRNYPDFMSNPMKELQRFSARNDIVKDYDNGNYDKDMEQTIGT